MRKPEAYQLIQDTLTELFNESGYIPEDELAYSFFRRIKEKVVDVAISFDRNSEILMETIIGIASQMHPDYYSDGFAY